MRTIAFLSYCVLLVCTGHEGLMECMFSIVYILFRRYLVVLRSMKCDVDELISPTHLHRTTRVRT